MNTKQKYNKMKQLIFFSISLSILLFGAFKNFQPSKNDIESKKKDYPKSLVSLNDFQKLASEIKQHRAKRLVSLDSFIEFSKDENTIILDTRSKLRYNRKHIAGAIHLAFTEFSQANLDELIPNRNARILIYCNNNFEGDQIDFTSKISTPSYSNSSYRDNLGSAKLFKQENPIMLALNIPTYLNLYGYGYKNIYELDELVNVNDSRIKFEGSMVRQIFPVTNASN